MTDHSPPPASRPSLTSPPGAAAVATGEWVPASGLPLRRQGLAADADLVMYGASLPAAAMRATPTWVAVDTLVDAMRSWLRSSGVIPSWPPRPLVPLLPGDQLVEGCPPLPDGRWAFSLAGVDELPSVRQLERRFDERDERCEVAGSRLGAALLLAFHTEAVVSLHALLRLRERHSGAGSPLPLTQAVTTAHTLAVLDAAPMPKRSSRPQRTARAPRTQRGTQERILSEAVVRESFSAPVLTPDQVALAQQAMTDEWTLIRRLATVASAASFYRQNGLIARMSHSRIHERIVRLLPPSAFPAFVEDSLTGGRALDLDHPAATRALQRVLAQTLADLLDVAHPSQWAALSDALMLDLLMSDHEALRSVAGSRGVSVRRGPQRAPGRTSRRALPAPPAAPSRQ